MNRRPVVGLAGVLALTVWLAGCGVPTSSEVQYVGPGPEIGPESPDRGQLPPTEDAAATAQQQVDNFLQAAAGSPGTAHERVRDFIRATERGRWNPEEQIRVVRLLQTPAVTQEDEGGWRVELTVQQIGTLYPAGYLDTVTGGETSYQFRVVLEGEVAGESPRYRIAEPPPVMLLQDAALTDPRYFYPTPIYFWDEDHEELVPDLRWLPTAGGPLDQHPLIVLQWLIGGPAPSLSRLQGLPPGTQPIGTPGWEDDDTRLVVNLDAAALGGRDVNDLATQLAWSLLQLGPGTPSLDLRIDDQQQTYTIDDPPWTQADPVRLAVLDGAVQQLAGGDPASFPVLSSEEVNAGVLAAALTGGGRLGALVRADEDSGGERLSVVRAEDGDEPVEEQTGLVADDIGQPTWLREGDDGLGLVVAGGDLYRFTAAGDFARVSVSGLAGRVTAMAVAPERRRVALVAGDELYVALLQLDGDVVVVESPRTLPTTVEGLAGVAFSHEDRLVIAGEVDDRVGLYSLTVDGGWQQRLHELGNVAISSLVAYPLEERTDLDAMYEASGQAFTVDPAPDLVRAEELLNAPQDTEASPRSPFYVD